MSSDTPRTDTGEYEVQYGCNSPELVVSSALCRQLERELKAAREQIEQRAKIMREIMSERDKAESDLALAREELQKERARFKQLRKAVQPFVGVVFVMPEDRKFALAAKEIERIDAAMKEDAK